VRQAVAMVARANCNSSVRSSSFRVAICSGLLEHIGAVADYAIATAGGVARVAQVHGARMQAVMTCTLQQAIDGDAAAGIFVADVLFAQRLDGPRSGLVEMRALS